jgi:selenide,water dikinase
MRTLNKTAADVIVKSDAVHACTDITGFGFAGHASEMAIGSNVTMEINSKALPIIPGVLEIAAANRSGGMKTNEEYFLSGIEFLTGSGNLLANDARRDILFDPQTSGGLLISVAEEAADEFLAKLQKAGIQAVFVGSVEESSGKRLKIR